MHVKYWIATLVLAVATLTGALSARADVITDANARPLTSRRRLRELPRR
jgi:hypothetical protein